MGKPSTNVVPGINGSRGRSKPFYNSRGFIGRLLRGAGFWRRANSSSTRASKGEVRAKLVGVGTIPVDLDVAPDRNVVWDPVRRTMIPTGKALARGVLKYMLGRDSGDRADLLDRYKRALGVSPDDRSIRLPPRIRAPG
jgi:hypothetical protein